VWEKDEDIYSKDFGLYLHDALALYDKLKGKRKNVTLRCMNVAFEPPLKYADHEPVYRLKRVRGLRKKVAVGLRVKYPLTYTSRMMKVNRKGLWWCPYCIKFRRFEKRAGFEYEDIWVDQAGLYCPICDISNYDGGVRRFNPMATLIELRRKRKKKGKRG
jgi:hypothetical protein